MLNFYTYISGILSIINFIWRFRWRRNVLLSLWQIGGPSGASHSLFFPVSLCRAPMFGSIFVYCQQQCINKLETMWTFCTNCLTKDSLTWDPPFVKMYGCAGVFFSTIFEKIFLLLCISIESNKHSESLLQSNNFYLIYSIINIQCFRTKY